jgi:hypothetical protein
MPLFERSRATLVASLTGRRSPAISRCALDGGDGVEARGGADLVGDLTPVQRALPASCLHRAAPPRGAFGGCGTSGASARRAAGAADRVDLEGARDRAAEVLAAVPPEKRLLWHGPVRCGARGAACDARAMPAALYKLIVRRRRRARRCGRRAALHTRRQTSSPRRWRHRHLTRLLAPWLGAPWVAGRRRPASSRSLAGRRLRLARAVSPARRFGVIGTRRCTRSPWLHNVATARWASRCSTFPERSARRFRLEVEDGALPTSACRCAASR